MKRMVTRGFTLVEVLIVTAILLVLVSSGASLLGSKVWEKSLDAKTKEVVDLISQARNYAAAGYFGDAWGIIVLNNHSYCDDSGDCLVLFKGKTFVGRDISHDRIVNMAGGIYFGPSDTNEYYFVPVAGWLATTTAGLDRHLAEQRIILFNSLGEQKIVTTTPTGLVYYGD